MVFKQLKKDKATAEDIKEEVVKETEEKTKEDSSEEQATEKSDPSVVGYPVFLTSADVQRMTYENNQMLRQLMEFIQKED